MDQRLRRSERLRRRLTEEPYVPLPEYVEPEAEISTVEAGDLKLDSLLYYSTYAWGYGQSLYSIDLSQMSVSTESHLTSDIPITRIVVRPVLVFGTEWPRRMCCVRNDDCVYFFGGTLHNPDNDRESVSSCLTFRVRIADIELHRTSCEDDPSYLIEKNKVVDVGMMHMGKPYPYTFVAGGKIYVISLPTGSYSDDARFEAYTPAKDCWEVLCNPIFESEVISDLVFTAQGKVVLGTHEGYFCYDWVDDKWSYLNLPILTRVGSPRSHGAFLPISDDNIGAGGFWFLTTNHYPYVSVCGPTTGVDPTDRHRLLSLIKGSYKRFDGFSYRLMTYEPSYRVTKFLSYLGNGNFCLLCWGESADYETVEKPLMMLLRVVIFRVTPSPDSSDAINFTPQIVRVAHLDMDKQGSSRDTVDDCFTIRKDAGAGLGWLGER